MRHRIFAIVFGLAVSAVPARAEEKAAKPNIIYFLVDDMGSADCGFNGGKEIKTPNIDALAAKGSIFGSYYVQPLCSTTRASFLTGRYPVHHGIYGALMTDTKMGLPLEERILPQALKTAGYTTAITGKWHVGEYKPEYLPMRRGFDHQYGCWYGQIDYFSHERAGRVDWYRDDRRIEEKGYSTTLIADEATRLIQTQPADKPLFLYVPFNAVHGPFQVPEKYLEPYKHLPEKRRVMAGMLSVVDESIGRIVAALREKKMDGNTLIIFSGDNGGVDPGPRTSNAPLRAGKGTIYEGGVRTASFVTWPGKIPAGKKIATPVHVIDWYPTLVKLTGADAAQPLPVDGQDIWPLLTKDTPPARDAILVGAEPRRIAVRMGDWKLIRFSGGGKGKKGQRHELYNLAADPSEKTDLAASKPEKVTEMNTRLEELVKNPRRIQPDKS
ncbi:MAG: arylsulfatase [Verrucomicrobiaceae bacterium]|nr:MAG: arylsulfatase [Verrucomicrobiaceae bacterium]